MVQIADLEIADETGRLLASVARKRGQSVDDVVRAMLGTRDSQPARTDRRGESFQAVWALICELAGTEFRTRNGQRFSYRIEGDYVEPSTSDVRIPMSQFKKGLAMGPVRGPSSLRGVFAPSMVWAILNDDRITGAIEAASAPSTSHAENAHRRGEASRPEVESLPPVDAQISRVHQTWPDDSAYDEGDMPFKTVEPLREPARPASVPLYPQNAHVWAIGSAPADAGPGPESDTEPQESPTDELQVPPASHVSRVNAAAMATLTQAGVAELQRAQSRGPGSNASQANGSNGPVPVTALADMTIAEVLRSTGQAGDAGDGTGTGKAAATSGDVEASPIQSESVLPAPQSDDADRPEYALRSSPLTAPATPKLRGLFKKLFSPG